MRLAMVAVGDRKNKDLRIEFLIVTRGYREIRGRSLKVFLFVKFMCIIYSSCLLSWKKHVVSLEQPCSRYRCLSGRYGANTSAFLTCADRTHRIVHRNCSLSLSSLLHPIFISLILSSFANQFELNLALHCFSKQRSIPYQEQLLKSANFSVDQQKFCKLICRAGYLGKIRNYFWMISVLLIAFKFALILKNKYISRSDKNSC